MADEMVGEKDECQIITTWKQNFHSSWVSPVATKVGNFLISYRNL